jgi:hypothetical protein
MNIDRDLSYVRSVRAAYTVRVWTFIDSIAYHMNARHVRTYPVVMISMGTKRAVRTLLFDGTPLSLENCHMIHVGSSHEISSFSI